MNRKSLLLTALLLVTTTFAPLSLQAQQCQTKNEAFEAGEKIICDLYYRYGIMNVKAGTGFIETSQANYKGQNVYKLYMQANTSGVTNTMYSVNDTLTSYMDTNLVPLLFTKDARESKDYTKERQIYSYDDDGISIRTIRHRNGEKAFDETIETTECTYDYLSVLGYARNLDYSTMKAGQNIPIQFISGKRTVKMYIRYMGTTSVKVNNGKRYDAIQLSMVILDDAFTNPKEAMNVMLTNDKNRLPLIIETSLKMGSIRIILKKFSNTRHPVSAEK